MFDLTERPAQQCPIEAMKDDAFISAFKVYTVAYTRDIFLAGTRTALQKINDLRSGLIVEAVCHALSSVAVEVFNRGMNRSLDQKGQAIVLRRVARLIDDQANKIESGSSS
jgi:hypothetical protein